VLLELSTSQPPPAELASAFAPATEAAREHIREASLFLS
jgi:hypothetical protein